MKNKICLVLGLLLLACGQQKQPSTTLILVRHAEKAQDGSDNPPLTEKGHARALLLKNMLLDAGVDAIYSTPFQRNMQTVKPLAESLGMAIQTYDPRLGLPELMSQIQAAHPGQKVLICGHSNTVPRMLNTLLEKDTYPDLLDSEYDNLYRVSVPGKGKAVVTELKFTPRGF